MPPGPDGNIEGAFDDPVFLAILKEKLSLSPEDTLTQAILEGVEELHFYGDDRKISSLQGLQYAKNLVVASFSGESLSDDFSSLWPLANMEKLEEIHIGYAAGLSHLTPLANLTNLTS
ncbi:MAG: hypothetical protein GX786_04585, partial [Clostridiales bacterium]|nr:hypothetical protein [Clostridiales bacterium]